MIEKIAFSTNCLTAEKVCQSLHIPTSHDALLRRIRTASFENKVLPFVGIDDFAFKKRMSYGTIFIDLKTNQPIDLLNTRKQQDVTQWLKARPNIELITRDGSKTYAKAVAEASSSIFQVSDRWHILHQLFEAIKKTITDTIPVRWKPQQSGQPNEQQENPSPPLTRKSDVQRIRNEEKRWTRIQKVQHLHKQGYTVTAIQEICHISRGTVYKDLRQTERSNHQRASPYQKFRPLIHSLVLKKQSSQQIEENCRAKGYKGSRATLNTMIAEERRNPKVNQSKSYFFRQQIIHIIWDFKESNHKKRFLQLHPSLLHAFPVLKEIDELVHSFRNLFIKKDTKALDDWMTKYNQQDFPHVQAFINGLKQDIQAVKLSVQEDWNNGVTEGNVNQLKTIKRLMYGRAGFSVLKNRVLYQF